jgi:hypothetical protein
MSTQSEIIERIKNQSKHNYDKMSAEEKQVVYEQITNNPTRVEFYATFGGGESVIDGKAIKDMTEEELGKIDFGKKWGQLNDKDRELMSLLFAAAYNKGK